MMIRKGTPAGRIGLGIATTVLGAALPLSSHALDKQFVAYKQTQVTPFGDEDSVVFPGDSVTFDSTTFTELTYSSPTSKKFSVEVSALLDADKEIDQLKAIFNWGGIMLVTSQGSIKGRFSETDEARFPGNQDPDELFQTLLPEDPEFDGKSQFLAVGVQRYGDRYVGIGYEKSVFPVLLDVDTNQNPEFGFNSRTGEFERYNEEGNYPYQAIDAEGTIETIGLWLRVDSLKNSFDQVASTGKRDIGLFLDLDILMGFSTYTPGDQVEIDYENATEQVAADTGNPGEGTALNVSGASSLFSISSTYGVGFQAVAPVADYIIGASLGVEGTLNTYTFESDYDIGPGVEAEYGSESFFATYGIFFRVAGAF
jgi:hypothetical protein